MASTIRARRVLRAEDELKGVEDVVGDARPVEEDKAAEVSAEALEDDRKFVLQEEQRRLARLKHQRHNQANKAKSSRGSTGKEDSAAASASAPAPAAATATTATTATPAGEQAVGASRVWKTSDPKDLLSTSTDSDVPVSVMDTVSVLARRSGWLLKQSRKGLLKRVKVWKRQYFSLEDKFFTYRDDEYEYELSGILPVKSIVSVGLLDISDENGFPFFVALPKRTLIMLAESEKDAKGWVQSLRKARALCTGNFGEDEQVTELIF